MNQPIQPGHPVPIGLPGQPQPVPSDPGHPTPLDPPPLHPYPGDNPPHPYPGNPAPTPGSLPEDEDMDPVGEPYPKQ